MELAFLGLQTIFGLLVVICTTCSKRKVIQDMKRKESEIMNDKIKLGIELEIPEVLAVLIEDGKISLMDVLLLHKYLGNVKVVSKNEVAEMKTVVLDEGRN